MIRLLARVGFILSAVTIGFAERLPVETYTIADGLPMDGIAVLRKDSRHLIWVGTGEGVAWFDGQRFNSYTTEDGLPHRSVTDLLETRRDLDRHAERAPGPPGRLVAGGGPVSINSRILYLLSDKY